MHLAADLFQRYVFCCDYIFFQVCCEATLRLVQFTCSAGEVRLTCCQVILCFAKGLPPFELPTSFFLFFLFSFPFLFSMESSKMLQIGSLQITYSGDSKYFKIIFIGREVIWPFAKGVSTLLNPQLSLFLSFCFPINLF